MSDSPKITLESMMGGKEFLVTRTDGQQEKVFIKTAKLSELQTLVSVHSNLAELIAFTTGKPVSWVDSLDPDSAFALYDRALELNRPILGQWRKRLLVLAEQMMGSS